MSITDELRKYATVSWNPWPAARDRLFQMCDHIDAEHERVCKEQYACGAEHGIGASIEASMIQEHGFIELPKDADGEYIHEHDKVDWRDHAGVWHENATVVAVCNDGCYVTDGIVLHVHKSDIRHHHPDTWERIIDDAEALAREWFNTDMSENEHAEGLDALVARCKVLAGDE